MPPIKIYSCCICHKILTEKKPHRLVHQEYGINGYHQMATKNHYDFCDRCFKTFAMWIKKHREEVSKE